MTPGVRDAALVQALQAFVGQDKVRVLQNNRFLPANSIVEETLEWSQVGVMLVLVPM